MEFGHSYFLLLLLILPILILWYFKKGQAQEATVRFSNLDLIPENVVRNGWLKNIVFVLGRILIMFFIILALARPRLSDTIRESKTEIIDILLVIDQSSSMLAQDFKPNRLEAVKTALTQVEVFRLTLMDVQGFGRQKGHTETYRGHDLAVNLLRKVRLEIAVNDDFLDRTMETISEVARTGPEGNIGHRTDRKIIGI